MSEEKELIVIDDIDPAKIFQGEGLDELLTTVQAVVMTFEGDVTTAVGRADIKSLAYKIARAKTMFDDLGKNHVADEKAKIKVIDKHRKKAKDFLTNLQTETRKPLTEWEHAEEKRLQDIRDRIEAITDMAPTEAYVIERLGLAKLKDRLNTLENYVIDEFFEELTPIAKTAKEDAIRSLTETVARVKKHVEDQAELDKLREEAAKRQKKDDEEAAAKEATKEAERAAEVENDRLRKEKEDADQRVIDAKAETQRKVDLAKEQERVKIKKEQDDAADLVRIRANDRQHKGRIHREIVACLQKIKIGGVFMEQKDAQKIVTAMAKGDLKRVQINY